jgi:hypothetical protein
VAPAPEAAPLPPAPEPEPVYELEPEVQVPPPVAARTILPTREKGLLRRRTVAPVEPVAAPQVPRHSVPPVIRPAGLPQHSAPTIPAAPVAPAPAPIRMPPPPVQAAPVPAAPARAAAPAPAPVGLPNRGPRHEAPVPASVEAVGELSPLAQLSQLASASYTPQIMTPTEAAPPAQRALPEPDSAGLVRREPAVMPVADIDDVEQPIRPRAAGDVRSMLSGFRAGVQRGRDGSHTNRPGHGVDNLRRD